jgi:hypothetical protein
MDIFVVPFKTIVLRLHEVGKLPEGTRYIKLLSTDTKSDDSEVVKLQKINGKCLKNSESTNVKNMPNYIQTAIDLYLANYKTEAKLKAQLDLFDLTLEELHLAKEKESFPTEEELKVLMADEDENL